jgi:hypothetical protein
MKWEKSPEELTTTFESVMPGPPAVMRKMFGFPTCAAQKPICGPANYRNGWLLTQLTASARNCDDWHFDSLVSPVESRCDAAVKTQHFSSCFLSRL